MVKFDPGSFRDPEGRVFFTNNRIFRTASPQALERIIKNERFLKNLVRKEKLVDFGFVDAQSVGIEGNAQLLETQQVPVVSYPYEWSFDMLKDAGLLTLEICETALQENLILKDASAFNLLFRNNQPVFIDLLSFDIYDENQSWAAYSQFCRAFLFPLLLRSYRRIEFQPILRGYLGEIPARETQKFFRTRDLFKSGVIKDVLMQARFESHIPDTAAACKVESSMPPRPISKRHLIQNLQRLRKIISNLHDPIETRWLNYNETNTYSTESAQKKQVVVDTILSQVKPARALDLGCNYGVYSEIALKYATQVLSVDFDSSTINALYQKSRSTPGLNLFVGDLANASPAMGWKSEERRPLHSRIQSDVALALALIHHLRFSAGIPLDLILDGLLAISLRLIIEWVDPEDAMVKELLRDRKNIFVDYNWANFKGLVEARAEIKGIHEIGMGTRKICHIVSKRL